MLSTDIVQAFRTTTEYVFTQAVQVPLETCPSTDLPDNAVTALIAVTGSLEGLVLLAMGRATALAVAEAMTGDHLSPDDELVEGVVVEITNMVVGRTTGELERLGLRCDISPPALVSGQRVEVAAVGIPPVTLGFQSRLGPLTLRLELRRRGAQREA